MNENKIAYIEHEGKTFYVYVEIILKRNYRLTKYKEMATPFNEEEQRKVKEMDDRVKFMDVA